jgi:chromosome segregation ATPase
MSTVQSSVQVGIHNTIVAAYTARMKAQQSLQQLDAEGVTLAGNKADAWAANVASNGVDPTTVVSTYESAEKELTAHQQKIVALQSLLRLLEGRISQLKTSYRKDVVVVLKQQIAAIQQTKTADEKDIQAADEAIQALWHEVHVLEPPATSSKKGKY